MRVYAFVQNSTKHDINCIALKKLNKKKKNLTCDTLLPRQFPCRSSTTKHTLLTLWPQEEIETTGRGAKVTDVESVRVKDPRLKMAVRGGGGREGGVEGRGQEKLAPTYSLGAKCSIHHRTTAVP